MAAFWLTVVGAVNWGLVALLKLNLVTMLLGEATTLTTLVYLLVGASGVYVGMNALNKGKK